jgi:hypothetical protein
VQFFFFFLNPQTNYIRDPGESVDEVTQYISSKALDIFTTWHTVNFLRRNFISKLWSLVDLEAFRYSFWSPRWTQKQVYNAYTHENIP